MTGGSFDDLVDVFDSIIDWPRRLAHEEPFYRRLFEQADVKSVLDAACGTGRHAAMFHSWGLRVQGADISPGMIARARAGFGEPAGLHWIVRGFDQRVEEEPPFDAAVCVGNSLALAADVAVAKEAVGRMLAAVRPGGVVVAHVLNIWAMPDGPCVWQRSVRARLADGPALIVKGVHRCGDRAYVELLVNPLEGDAKFRSQSVPFLGLEAAELEQAMRHAGADRVGVFGGYQGQPFDRRASGDLVMVAWKRGPAAQA